MNQPIDDTIETEQALLKRKEEQESEEVEEESSKPLFGRDLKRYLAEAQKDYRDLGNEEEASVVGRLAEEVDVPDDKPIERNAQNSRAVAEVFFHMETWKQQMRHGKEGFQEKYMGSKRVFERSCHTLYPKINEQATLGMMGSEMIRIARITGPEIGNLPTVNAKLKEVSLEKIANNISSEKEENPLALKEDIEKTMAKISEGMREDIRNGISEEGQKEIDFCVQLLYELQLFANKLESKKQEEGKTEKERKTEDEENDLLREAEDKWKIYFEKDMGSMEDFLQSETYRDINWADFDDKQKAEWLSTDLRDIWQKFQEDERPAQQKIRQYKIAIGELIRQANP